MTDAAFTNPRLAILQPPLPIVCLAINRGGSDAITPPERSQKNWGPNSRTPEFNEHEGKRRPVIDGGSHEGGLREDGKGSKT